MNILIKALIAVLIVCSAEAAERVEIPSTLHAAIGGSIWSDNYNVYLQDGQVHYTVTNRGSNTPTMTLAVTPTPQQWAAFRKTLDACDAWTWRRRYNSSALDQNNWTVMVMYRGKEVNSEGYGKVPPNFEKFREAIRDLIGRKDIQF